MAQVFADFHLIRPVFASRACMYPVNPDGWACTMLPT